MKEVVFETKLLPDGHLYCPKKFAKKKNVRFKVTVIYEEPDDRVSEQEMELSTVQDLSDDFLSEKEVNYYLNLEEI